MDNKKLKNLLRETLEIEDQLYDFCIECLKKIYGENAHIAINDFEQGYNSYDWNGCIQSLVSVDAQVSIFVERMRERQQKKQD